MTKTLLDDTPNERIQTIQVAKGVYLGFNDEMMYYMACGAFRDVAFSIRDIVAKYEEEKRQEEYAQHIERKHFSKK